MRFTDNYRIRVVSAITDTRLGTEKTIMRFYYCVDLQPYGDQL